MKRSPFRRVAMFVGALLLILSGYLLFWPVPADPKSWTAPTAAGFVGPYAQNTKLAALQTIDIGSESGPEHMLIGPDGKLYAAMTSGALLRMDPGGGHREVFANTGGRVLGFAFDTSGRMIAADAMRGLLAIGRDGQVALLTDRVNDADSVHYANAVVIAADGVVYFTDASGRFAPRQWGGTLKASVLDILEQAATGRVLAYDPVSRKTWVVARGFSFANGLALSADGQSLFVSETGQYRIWKVDARARDLDVHSNSAQAKPLIENLPGYPDNLMRGTDGRIWVGLFRPRNAAADGLSDRPFIRRILLRLPQSMLPVGKPYGHVVSFTEDGVIADDWQDSTGAYPATTGVTETADRMYIHSLTAPTIGWVAKSRESIYVLRSIREPLAAGVAGCSAAVAGFDAQPNDGERSFSFYSVTTRAEDGRVTDAHAARVASLHGCFGATSDRARQLFYAEIAMGSLTFKGRGECLALAIDTPEPGLYPVRCQLVLSDLPAPYVGGLLTTNTLTSKAAFGGETDPPGYAQASIATIRLWTAR